MSDRNGTSAAPQKEEVDPAEPLEKGRYAVLGHPSGRGLLIYRATGTCQRCQDCGCGDQQEVIDLSAAGVMGMAGKLGKLRGMVRL